MDKGSVKAARLSLPDRLLRGFAYGMIHLVQRPRLSRPKPVLEGPAIFACRHVGLMDPVILMVEYYRKMLHPLVALDYYEANGFTRSFYDHAQCIPIDRKGKSKKWLEDSVAALRKGECIIIFPEGKRNKSEKGLLPFKHGVAMLAAASGAPVIPVYNKVWHFPHRYKMGIGSPIQLPPIPEGMDTDEWINAQTAVIQEAVAALEAEVEAL